MDYCRAQSIRFDGEEFQLTCDLEAGHPGNHYYSTNEVKSDGERTRYLISWVETDAK